MRGPSEDPPWVLEIQDLREENRQLKGERGDLLDENHDLKWQVERALSRIAELEQEVADLSAALAGKDMAG